MFLRVGLALTLLRTASSQEEGHHHHKSKEETHHHHKIEEVQEEYVHVEVKDKTFHTDFRHAQNELGDNGNRNCHKGKILPTVFVLGAQKAGSSTLWRDLVAHFPVSPAKVLQGDPGFLNKEPHFFDSDDHWEQGPEWYLNHFPRCDSYDAERRTLDGTPNYLGSGHYAAPRIKKLYADRAKDLKFIIIVRDPAKRMEAGYWHFMPNHLGGFDDFVNQTIGKAYEWIQGKGGEPYSPNPYHGSLYGRFVKEWLNHFDADQFTLVTLQQYNEDPQEVLNFIAKRTGMTALSPIHGTTHANAREHEGMSDETKALLDKYFAADMQQLHDLQWDHKFGMGSGVKENNVKFREMLHEDAMDSQKKRAARVGQLWDLSKAGEEFRFRQLATGNGLHA